jgi:lipoprotein-releasing system permease protein
MEKTMFAVIMGTLVLVAMFNIISTLILRILYKAKDISVLSAIGMKRFSLKVMFTFHGTMIGIAGTLAGSFLGGGFAFALARWKLIHIEPEIYFLSSLPVRVDLKAASVVILAGAVVSIAVSMLAAGRVFALNIAEGLKEG